MRTCVHHPSALQSKCSIRLRFSFKPNKSSPGYPLLLGKVFVSKIVVGNNKLTLNFLMCVKTSKSMSCHKITNMQDTVKQ